MTETSDLQAPRTKFIEHTLDGLLGFCFHREALLLFMAPNDPFDSDWSDACHRYERLLDFKDIRRRGRLISLNDSEYMINSRQNMVVGISSFSPEDQRRRLEESIAYSQAAGPRAIWDAACEITAEWFLLRGIDPTTQRVDKTVSGILPVPCAKAGQTKSDEGAGGVTV